MSQQIDREGTFQGLIVETGLREYDSGSLAVFIRANLDTCWNGSGWDDWREYQMEASGFIYVIKKDGTPNKAAAESLIRFAGWDGTLASIIDSTWQPTLCQFTVKANQYEGKTEYRIEFVNDHDRTPGQMTNIDGDRLKALEAKYGSSLRAIAGSVKASSAPTGTKMPAPKKPAAKAPDEPAGVAPSDGVPF